MAEIGHYLESIIPPTVHLVLLAVFMEVSPFFTIWLAVLRVSFWWGVWYFEAAWWRCRVCIGWILVAESDVYLVAHWYVLRREFKMLFLVQGHFLENIIDFNVV